MSASDKKREIRYDIARFAAIILTVASHAQPKPFPKGSYGAILLPMIYYCCNSVFFMLSGRFNLAREFRSPSDYRSFYRDKAVTILLPFFLFTCLYNYLALLDEGLSFTFSVYVKSTIKAFMGGNAGSHLWFVYTLAGLMLSTPFLSRMLHAMSDAELNILFGAGIFWNAVSICLTADAGIPFGFNGWLLQSWALQYFLGYWVLRMEGKIRRPLWYAFGVLCLAANSLWSYILPENNKHSEDLAPLFVFWALAVYLFLTSRKKDLPAGIARFVTFAASHTYMVYLCHNTVRKRLLEPAFTLNVPSPVKYPMAVVLCLVLSLAAAALADSLVIFPLQRLLKGRSALRSPRKNAQ